MGLVKCPNCGGKAFFTGQNIKCNHCDPPEFPDPQRDNPPVVPASQEPTAIPTTQAEDPTSFPALETGRTQRAKRRTTARRKPSGATAGDAQEPVSLTVGLISIAVVATIFAVPVLFCTGLSTHDGPAPRDPDLVASYAKSSVRNTLLQHRVISSSAVFPSETIGVWEYGDGYVVKGTVETGIAIIGWRCKMIENENGEWQADEISIDGGRTWSVK